MPPTVALVLTLAFITFLFRRDFREKPNITGAVWLPTIWIFIIASRPVSEWLRIFGWPGFGGSSLEEGSSFDAFVYFGLMASGTYVLNKRHVRLSEIVRDNRWLVIFILYCLLAVFWSDYPLSSFKRWIKILGHPIMVLVLFTEPDPEEAMARLMKRCAYVLFPVSILWMKYYPALGRNFDEWGGTTNVGIAGGKNELGAVCLMFGLFLFWHFLQVWQRPKGVVRRNELVLTAGILLLLGYTLKKAHSSTSLISLALCSLVMISLGLRFINKKQIWAYTISALLILLVAQATFDIYGAIVDWSGRESTIEGRGRLWQLLLETNTHPIFGTGFESYWLGERLQKIWAIIEWHPTHAHNGYLEIYLNLGIVGLCILLGVVLVVLRKCIQDLTTRFEWGRFTLAYLIAVLAHNWTEAGFKGLSIIYCGFFLAAVKDPQLRIRRVVPTIESTESHEEVAYSERRIPVKMEQ